METFFGYLEEEVLEEVDLLNNLEYEVKYLSTTENDYLKEHICRMEETNA